MEAWFAARPHKSTVPIRTVRKKALEATLRATDARTRRWLQATGFDAGSNALALIPGEDGKLSEVLIGGSAESPVWAYAGLPRRLPEGRYTIADELSAEDAEHAALGWGLGCYDFDRYRKRRTKGATLVWPAGVDRARVLRLGRSTNLVRDLVNTPANDMGPAELEQAARDVAAVHGARVRAIRGDALLAKNWPMVHAVGRASSREPRLIDLRWGAADDPKVTLVGKGVCFDSGGLDLKPASGMLLMKKDMGGAAHVLGLAQAIMDAGLRVRLRVLVAAVENSVSGNAFRPLDVIKTRKGLTVEIGNTDAEGRLVLCDALAEADTEKPDVLLDYATLTGAARVALGTALPALFSSDDRLAGELLEASERVHDPVWRLPLHRPYRRMLDSKTADLGNVASGGFGGAITAALFLQRFVSPKTPWAHFDLMAWNSDSKPGRPPGGEAMALRATYAALEARYPAGRGPAKKTAAKKKTAKKKTAKKKTAKKKTASRRR